METLKRFLRMGFKIGVVIVMLAVAVPLLVRGSVRLWSSTRIYAVEEAPEKRVALVLGARVYNSGRLSAMLADRVAAAAELYHAGAVDVLLMSGDNSTDDYNEPGAMRDYAISLGVSEDDIVLDYGGRRTYDSCYRAHYIFGVDEAIIVTQDFHLPRALMLCSSLGIDSAGVAADAMRPGGYSQASMTYSQVREFPATLLAVVDMLRQPLPPIMGEPLPIFEEDALD